MPSGDRGPTTAARAWPRRLDEREVDSTFPCRSPADRPIMPVQIERCLPFAPRGAASPRNGALTGSARPGRSAILALCAKATGGIQGARRRHPLGLVANDGKGRRSRPEARAAVPRRCAPRSGSCRDPRVPCANSQDGSGRVRPAGRPRTGAAAPRGAHLVLVLRVRRLMPPRRPLHGMRRDRESGWSLGCGRGGQR